MEELKLLRFDNPILRQSPPLFDFHSKEVNAKELADKLFYTQQQLGGIGLSANQVGIPYKIFVLGKDDESRRNIFNPKIVSVSDEFVTIREGCLSFKGLWLNITRPRGVVLSYQNVEGETIVETFNGITARVVLHEYDHMVGKNFTDYASKMKLDLAFKKLEKKAKKYLRNQVQGATGNGRRK